MPLSGFAPMSNSKITGVEKSDKAQKKVAFLCRFFRPTSDVNISKTVYPIYLKIKVQRVPTSHSSHINFRVNRITRFRDIVVGSWPEKTTKKTKFF